MRVTNDKAVIAIPTICNPCSLVQVGGGMFWLKGKKRSILALPWGLIKMLYAFISFQEGVNEGYAGQNVPHIFRFPGIMKKKIKFYHLSLVEYEASSICLPDFDSFVPIISILDKYKKWPILRNFGYGTTYVVSKRTHNK